LSRGRGTPGLRGGLASVLLALAAISAAAAEEQKKEEEKKEAEAPKTLWQEITWFAYDADQKAFKPKNGVFTDKQQDTLSISVYYSFF